MGLKEFIDNHPAVYTVSFIVAAIGATTAVVDYLNDRSTTALRQQHAARLAELRSSLNTQISDLATRLNSIERRFGDGTTFFDVTKLSIAPGQSRTLPTEYRPYRNGRFFVHVPLGREWRHQPTTEGAYYRDVLKGRPSGMPQSLLSQLDTAPIDIWRHSETLEFSMPFGGKERQVRLFPHVLIQIMSRRQLEDVLRPILRDDALTKILDDLSAKVRGYSEGRIQDSENSKRVEDLAGIMFDDVTGFMLMSRLQMHYMMAAQMKNVRFRVLSAQKKGNVVYLRSQRILYDDTDRSQKKVKLLLDEELFLVGTGSEVVLVSVQVPSKHGQHDAFKWTTAWLAGLRIAIGT